MTTRDALTIYCMGLPVVGVLFAAHSLTVDGSIAAMKAAMRLVIASGLCGIATFIVRLLT